MGFRTPDKQAGRPASLICWACWAACRPKALHRPGPASLTLRRAPQCRQRPTTLKMTKKRRNGGRNKHGRGEQGSLARAAPVRAPERLPRWLGTPSSPARPASSLPPATAHPCMAATWPGDPTARGTSTFDRRARHAGPSRGDGRCQACPLLRRLARGLQEAAIPSDAKLKSALCEDSSQGSEAADCSESHHHRPRCHGRLLLQAT